MLAKKPFRWTQERERAASLLAEGRETVEEIAASLGVHFVTLHRWKAQPEFAARVAEYLATYRAAVRARGIAILENRVAALGARWELLQQVIRERAADPEHQRAPGGGTGLLVQTYKVVGTGASAEAVTEFAVDTGLLKELREHEKQAAQELGQWTEKQEHTGSLQVDLSAEAAAFERRLLSFVARSGPGAPPPGGPGDVEGS